MELLKNVLIKEVDGSKDGDKVFYVDNLPKSLLYREALALMIDYTDPHGQQNYVPEFTLTEAGKKIPTRRLTDELLPGIERSQTSDKAYVFFMQYNEAKLRLKDIDQFIQTTMPVLERIPRRISISTQPGVMSAGPKALSDLPRVVLPEPVSPPAPQNSGAEEGNASRSLDEEAKLEAMRQRAANARAAKAVQELGA